MLYLYKDKKNKVFIKPSVNKIVEVEVAKQEGEYVVIPTNNKIVESNIANKLTEIDLKTAYEMTHKKPTSKLGKISLED